VKSATYAYKARLTVPLVSCCFETLVDKMTGLNRVINRDFRALLRMTIDPAKNTVADRNDSWSVAGDGG
jgi:hypothetical protein